MASFRSAALLALTLAAIDDGSLLAAQERPPAGTLRVTVKDPSGAVIPGAVVAVTSPGPPAPEAAREAVSDAQGVARVTGLAPGRYSVAVSFPGFETAILPNVRVRSGETRREVPLAIEKVDESVSVGRDGETNASDPRSDRFGTVLTKEQIDALPDDPDEMERVLKEMAGPGGTIRVDGFRGGRLPPKSQIRSIRFASGMFAAENHGGGLTFVDIATQPGMGPIRGSADFTFRDDAMNARNAFQQQKGPERSEQVNFSLSGTLLENRTSFSIAAGGASLYDSANVFAALVSGTTTAVVRRPSDRMNFTARVDHALTKSHTLRGSFQQNGGDQRNLGVGSYDLPDRAFERSSTERVLRIADSGPWGRLWFGESRLQVRWAGSESVSAADAPTVRVLDAFTAGGAQQAGGRDSTDVEWATNVDWARGRHAVRFGTLVEAGRYRSDTRTNFLGTYTFASLADFEAGLPSTYSRRTGDPLVTYNHWQAGVYVQDDWRARRNLTISAGLRQEFQAHLGDDVNLGPRAGITWSPFRHGRTTIRSGGGIFYEWLEAETYEQTLRVDGFRQQDLVVRGPGYPDPFAGGSAQVLPASRYQLARGLVMPRRDMITAGLTQQFSPSMGVNATLTYMRGTNRFRGRNVNAPLAGVRPDPAVGNVTQVESTGRMRGAQFMTGLNVNVPSRRMFLFVNYGWADMHDDADGPFSLPADSYDLAAEWGPSASIPRHFASAMLHTPVVGNLRLGLTATAQSGPRYNITTGRDGNGDTVFNDRPEGTGRNSATAGGIWDVAARLSYAFGFGERQDAGAGAPNVVVRRVGPGAGSAGDLLGGPMGGGGAENKRVRFELYVSASNLFNRVNRIGYSGVMTSPFFGQPTAALPGRKIDLGLRVGF